MKSKSKMLIAAAAMALGGLVSGSAFAVPVSEFFFTQNAGWLNPDTDGNAATYTNPIAFKPTDPTGFTLSVQNPTGAAAPAGTFGTMKWTDNIGNFSAIHVNTYDSNGPGNPTSFSSGVPAYGDTNGTDDYRGLRLGWILDIFADAADRATKQALLRAVLAEFRAAGVARAQAFSMNAALASDLRRRGFVAGRSPMQFCVHAKPESPAVFGDLGRWHVVFGDSDMDR